MRTRPLSDPDSWYDPDTEARAMSLDKPDIKEWLLKASRVIYIAVDEAIADDISDGLLKALARIAELEADANAVVHLHALAIEVGNLPDGDESVYDFLQRIITTGSPASIRARSDALRARIAELEAERDIVQSACNDISDQLRDRTIELKASAARIAELEAERDNAERERFRFGALNKGLSNRIAELEAALDRVAKFIKDWDSGNPDTPDGWFYEEFSDEYAALMVAIRARPTP